MTDENKKLSADECIEVEEKIRLEKDAFETSILRLASIANPPDDLFDDFETPAAKDVAESIAVGLYQIIITSIELYSQHTDYNRWSLLSESIAEMFDQDLIDELDRSYVYLITHSGSEDHEFAVLTERTASQMRSLSLSVQRIDLLNDDRAREAAQVVMKRADNASSVALYRHTTTAPTQHSTFGTRS